MKVLTTQLNAKEHGFDDVVYLDAKTDTCLEEVSSCNIFVVKGNKIKTPPLEGTILPGVTRKSILELAKSRGYEVSEENVTAAEAMEVCAAYNCFHRNTIKTCTVSLC